MQDLFGEVEVQSGLADVPQKWQQQLREVQNHSPAGCSHAHQESRIRRSPICLQLPMLKGQDKTEPRAVPGVRAKGYSW